MPNKKRKTGKRREYKRKRKGKGEERGAKILLDRYTEEK